MKPFIKLSLLLVLLLPATASAYNFVVDGIYYSIENESEVSVTEPGAYLSNVTIPETVMYNGTTYSVTSIGGSAFSGRSGMSSITIPNSVTTIGEYAFSGCTSLTSIMVPNSVTSIGIGVFASCSNLIIITVANDNHTYDSRENCNAIVETATNALIAGCANTVIPNTITAINNGAFSYCYNLTSINIPNSVTEIGEYTFINCNGLTSVNIPNSVTEIGNYAFAYCFGLANINIGNSVIHIGDNAFCDCDQLTSINIPNSVKIIGNSAFWNCSSVANINIGNSVIHIGDNAFSSCNGLTSVNIPNSVTSIGSYAFSDCSGLTSISIPDYVTTIGDGAFKNCSGLTSITIPSSVSTIGAKAFYGCTKIHTLYYNAVNCADFSSYSNNQPFSNTSITTISIGDNVQRIPAYFAYDFTELTNITIPNSVTEIGYYAFGGCSGIKELTWNAINCSTKGNIPTSNIEQVTIGDAVQIIPDYFVSNSIITEVTIPNSVTNIGDNAFSSCNRLTSINIPNSVTGIGSNAFSDCSGLTSINIPNYVTSIGDRAFFGCTELDTLYFNAFNCSFSSSYSNPPFYGLNISTINIGDSVQRIPEHFASGLTKLTSIIIPNSVTIIGDYAFNGCTGLTSIIIPNSVTEIGHYAFSECIGLTSINIPNSVTTIGGYTFNGCTGLTSATIPNSVTTIGNYAFNNCTELDTLNYNAINLSDFSSYSSLLYGLNITTINIGDSVQRIPAYFASSLTNLTSITIGKSVTSFGNKAFYNCNDIKQLTWNAINCSSNSIPTSNIEKVTIGDEVQVLPNNFVSNSKVTEVTIGKSITTIDNYAFYNCTNIKRLTWNAINCSSNSIPTSNIEKVTIGDEVQIIPDYFVSNSIISEVTVPNSVTYIGWYAFSDCYELNSVNIGNSVSHISYGLFSGCSGLTSINIPNSVTEIGPEAFSGCSGLTSIYIPSSVTIIGERAFQGCNGLISVNISDSVLFIGEYAFSCCSGLNSIHIPNSVTYICEGVFSGCSGLTCIDIPNSVTEIGNYAFSGCSGLTSVNIPNSITFISESAFSYCSGLTSIDIPNSVTSIGWHAFSGCSGLTSIVIPNSVTSIGYNAFSNCSGLTSISIPCSVTSIGNYAFQGCSGLDTLNFNAVNCADFSSTGNYRPFYNLNISTINIGDSVQRIPNYFANGLAALTDLTIGKSVTSIGNYAFSNCNGIKQLTWNASNCSSNGGMPTANIEQVKIGDEVQVIPQYFVRNSKITEVTFPNSVIYIGSYAFQNCSGLANVSIPNSVTDIDYYAFYGCSNLTRVDITDIAAWCNIYFNGQNANPLNYAQHLYWNNNEIINLQIPDSVTNIGSYAFINCSEVTNVSIPNSVTNIGGGAFTGCTGIKQLTWNAINCSSNGDLSTANIEQVSIGNEVQVIPNYFVSGSKINEVDIPNSVIDIGSYAFYGCTGLAGELTIPNSITNIGSYAFYGCTGLTSLTIGQSVTSIGSSAFFGCSGLTGELTIPASVAYINFYAFQGCTGIETLNYNAINCVNFDNASYQPFYNLNITTINIGDSVRRIPAYFAYGLSKLSSVTMPGSVTSVGTQAFYNCPIIESVTCLATTPPSTNTNGIDMFNTNVYIHSPLYVPMGTEKSYMYDQSWGQFINVIGIKVEDDVLATEITLDQSVMSMIIGTTSQLAATVLPDSTTNKAVSWASSNPNVATVDENGLVTAVGLGSASITAVTTDGSNLSASCDVTVISLSADNCFIVSDTAAQHGESITIPVKMINNETIMAFQTDIYLPDGFSIMTDDDEEYLVTPSSRLTGDHILMANDNNGVVNVVCYTPNSQPIGGNSGDDLFYITIRVPEDASGDYAIYLRNSRLTTENYTELRLSDAGAVVTVNTFIPGDVNDSHNVNVTDIVTTVQYLLQRNPSPFIFEAADMNGDGEISVTDIMLIARLILYPGQYALHRAPAIVENNDCMSGEDISITTGKTSRVSIVLDNEMDYSAFQLDLMLPDGLTAGNFALTSRAGSHALDVEMLHDGKVRALCYSPAIEAIDGNSGALLTFDVTATGFVRGDITVDGIELVTTDCQTVRLDAFSIGVNNATAVDELAVGKTVARVDYFNVAGQRIDRQESGVTLVVTTYTDGTRTTTKVIQ